MITHYHNVLYDREMEVNSWKNRHIILVPLMKNKRTMRGMIDMGYDLLNLLCIGVLSKSRIKPIKDNETKPCLS